MYVEFGVVGVVDCVLVIVMVFWCIVWDGCCLLV